MGLRNLTTRPPDTKIIRLTDEKETVAQIAGVNVGSVAFDSKPLKHARGTPAQTIVLGARDNRALADRLATHESSS